MTTQPPAAPEAGTSRPHPLSRNIASGTLVTLIRGCVMLAAYPLYLRRLGAEQYGLWVALGVVLSLGQFGNLGITTALTKLVSECRGRGEDGAVVSYIFTAAVSLVVSGCAAMLALYSLRGPLMQLMGIHGEHARTVAWLLPLVCALSIYMFVIEALNASLIGLGRMDLANYLDCGSRTLGVLVSAALLYRGWGIAALPAGTFCAYLMMHAIVVRILNTQLGESVFQLRHWSLERSKSLLKFGGGMLTASALGMLIGPLNKAFISRYLGLGAIPAYELAYSGAMQLRSVAESGMRALMPEVSRLGARRDEASRTAIRTLNRRAITAILILALPVFVAVLAASGPLLRAWLGARLTVDLQQSFRVMLAGTFFSLLCTPFYYTLVGLGNVRTVVQTYGVQALTNVATIAIGLRFLKMSVVLAAAGCAMGMVACAAYVIVSAARLTASKDLRVSVHRVAAA